MFRFGVLDIETSKYISPKIIRNGKEIDNKSRIPTCVWLNYGYCNIYDTRNNSQINNYFETWLQLETLFSKLAFIIGKNKIIIYVHNLSYEADFMFKNICKPSFLLSNKNHNVISCVLEKYPNITFKCSLMLSMKSLKKIGNDIGFLKLDSDYRTLLPSEKPTEKEKEYCLRDCDIVARYIKLELKEYKTIEQIPLTNTGRVRKDMHKEYISEYGKSDACEWDITPDEECFEALVNSYWGAITISNPRYTNRVMENVRSFDETSEYPYTLLANEFPYNIKKLKHFNKDSLINNKFWIAKLIIYNITKKYDWSWISLYKMQEYDKLSMESFNGKLQSCNYIVITMTNVDFKQLQLTYSFSSFEILEFYTSTKSGKMPDCIARTIIKYAREKTILKKELKALKETDDEYLPKNMEYLRVKGKLNSIYGMFVQSIQESEYVIDENFIWHEDKKEYINESKHIKRNFLFGIYCTAYARRDWIQFVLVNCPYTFIYGDTDSVKFISNKEVINTNRSIYEDYNDEYIKDFGKWDEEETYSRFITYGAKKYVYEHEKDGKIICNCTIAGLPKVPPNTYGNRIEDFSLGMTFDNCKNAHIYLYNDKMVELDDDCHYDKQTIYNIDNYTYEYMLKNCIKTQGGCAIFETGYTLNITDNDMEVINNYAKTTGINYFM